MDKTPVYSVDLPKKELQELKEELESAASLKQLAADPYWPKWNTPWWKMLLLWELKEVSNIPPKTTEALMDSVEKTYIDFFPLTEEELPKDIDPYRNIICHCALGSLYQLLHSLKAPVDERFPWMRPWFIKYQLPDGGLNCDEEVYTRETPRSSFLSTLPCLEAVLFSLSKAKAEERLFLEKGAKYLLSRKLCRSLSKGNRLIDENWLRPTFPRYYQYDALRGLRFIVFWAHKTDNKIPVDSVREVIESLLKQCDARLYPFAQEGTMEQKPDGSWFWSDEASLFPLLQKVQGPIARAVLTNELRETLALLLEKNLLS